MIRLQVTDQVDVIVRGDQIGVMEVIKLVRDDT